MIFNLDLMDGLPPISLRLGQSDSARLAQFLDECNDLENQVTALQDQLFDARQQLATLGNKDDT